MMSTTTHLTNLIDLPARQRKIIQLLLRNGTMLASDLRSACWLLNEPITHAELDDELRVLETVGWLVRDLRGDEPRYQVGSFRRTRKSIGDIWERLQLDATDQETQFSHPTPRDKANEFIEAISDKTALPASSGLMRRGGKRTLPDSIWDKLERETHVDENANNKPSPSTRRSLWDQLANHSEADSE